MREVPSFYITICIGLAQGLLDGRQRPASHHALNSFLAAMSFAGAYRRGRELTGGPLVRM